MPKVIQPKRLNKNITVESYWQIRNKQKKTKKQTPILSYRQDEVANRYRYLKPTQQAKLFNPLNYFFRRDHKNTMEDEQYANNFKNKQSTNVSQFLQSVRFRVSSPLIRIKKLVFGLKSIIFNHATVFNIILQNLNCEDSWPLLQAMIKDTKQQSYDYFIKEGLSKLAYQSENQEGKKQSIYQKFFKQTLFSNLFDTLAIFMQNNYNKIMQNINLFFKTFNKLFFNHPNKYIRKFSMKSVSYILNNFTLQQNLSLIFHILLNETSIQQIIQIPIGQLLLNRHKTVRGCLSSVQINKIIQTLKQIPYFLNKNFEENEKDNMNSQEMTFKNQLENKIETILIDYIAGILNLLETKFGKAQQNQNSNEILFDLNYFIKALVTFQQKPQYNMKEITLIQAFIKYLQNCDQKRFLTHNQKHQNYINQTFKSMLAYVQNATLRMMQSSQTNNHAVQISLLVGIIFTKNPKQCSKMILSKGIIHFCKQLDMENVFNLLQKIYNSELNQLDSAEEKSLAEFLLMTFSKFIKNFFQFNSQPENEDQSSMNTFYDTLYILYRILQKINFNNALNLSYLNLSKQSILNKLSKISSIHQFILYCRLLSLLNTQNQKDQKFNQRLKLSVKNIFQNLIKPFQQSLSSVFSQIEGKKNHESIFLYHNQIKNLLRYSHHEVEWVSLAFNLQECYKNCLSHINKNSFSQQISKQKWIWSQLSLNRTLKIDQQLTLQNIFQSSLNLLQSRNRNARKSILQRILQLWDQNQKYQQYQNLKLILRRLLTIDSQQIDLDNQRDIKKQFVLLNQQVSVIKISNGKINSQIVNLISNWIIGFVFTGFKLMNESILTFMNMLLDNFAQNVQQILLPFIEYYIYRHSRQFQYDISENENFVLRTPKRIQSEFNNLKEKEIFYGLMKEDFRIEDQITIEWIGLQRIGQAVLHSKKFRNNESIKIVLQKYLNQYFYQEFYRKMNTLSKLKVGQQLPNKYLILQPKTRFLAIMLKICPDTYLPPFQCLHYLSAQYLSLQSVHNIKQNRWQAIWVKKLKGSKTRQQITDTVNTTISLQKMSLTQQHLYAHFLWKQIIQSNQQKRRTIFQHIRDRVPDIIPYVFQKLFYSEMIYINNPQTYFSQQNISSEQKQKEIIAQIKQKLHLQNKKSLLNMMYLLKAMVVIFKSFLRTSFHMENIVLILRAIIQLIFTKDQKQQNKQAQEREQKQQQEGKQNVDNQEEQEQQEEEDQQNDNEGQKPKVSQFSLYKPHRKEIYKLFTQIFTHHSLQYKTAESILVEFSNSYLMNQQKNHSNQQKRAFSKIAYASINSVPGILILLKVISDQSFYHHLLMNFGIFQLMASIIDITKPVQQGKQSQQMKEQTQNIHKKKQSNPHAIKQCLTILQNIFHLNDQQNTKNTSKMVEQSHQQTHHRQPINYHKWSHQLQKLLKSINHYFLYSRNLQQTNNNSSNSNVQLQFYSNQNKQNLRSVQNNKNRNKNQHQRHQIQLKILDILWDVVSKIVSHKNQLKHDHSGQYSIRLDKQWQQIFWSEINKILKAKQLKQKQYHKLFKIVQIALIYFEQQNSLPDGNDFLAKLNTQNFLCKIISVLPYISQLSQRIKLTDLIHSCISTESYKKSNLIDQSSIKTVKQINSVKKNGLNIEIDYDSFFSAINRYAQENINFKKSQQMINQNDQTKQINLLSHQYVIFNLMPYLVSEQLSVRKAVREALNSFLVRMSAHLKEFEKQTLKVFNSVLRILIQQLKKNQIDNVFWSILSCIGLFIRFEVSFSEKFLKVFQNEVICSKLFSNLVKVNNDSNKTLTFESQSQEDFFHMITSISQGNKMKALKMLKEHCIKLRETQDLKVFKEQQKGSCLPHPISWMLSILQHLVLPVKHFMNQHQYNVQGNLTSTLTHISLEIYEQIIPFARQSLVKKQLKRLSTKIKFNETQRTNQDSIKKNILVIKIISSIVEGIDSLQKCTGNIKKHIQQYGFDDFHSKLIQNARKTYQDAKDSDQEQDQQDQKKKIEFGANLQQLQSQEAINRNFMMFDRKLMQMQQKQNQTLSSNQNSLIKFLKLHILIPLKLMLFYENKSSKQNKQEEDKSRMMISVAITKLLIKFPMEMFLFEFQKILSKICKLMKKRKLEIRQNGRKSLSQIAKIVGPQMLYAIVLELKFHLRDNFQKHIFNFTVYEIIQNLSPLKQGQLDYCLPLILPMIVDQMFGQASQQKKMVQANQVPVLNMETKKKKGHQLLILLSKQISVQRIRYMIDYLQKFLKEYLNSQANISKYEMMINHLTNGLGNNQQFIAPQNAGIFGQILCDSMYELRKQIKIYNFQEQKNKLTHQTTIKQNTQRGKKVGKQALLLQEQAGRNGSIFKKMSKQVYQKRNKQILINCLVQFYLALGSLLIKKQVLSLKTLQQSKQLTSNFIKIMQFVFQCMDHRDNRIVSKCMRLLHQALIWNYDKSESTQLKQSIKSLRKKVSRKILLFVQKLTSSDQQLLKESFVILIDLFTQVTITKEFLPSIIAIIKLHTNNQNDSANIPEPYRLLKLIIYKVPESIYDPLIYQMYELARINIVNSSIKEIRDVCKIIATTYVKNKEYLLTGIELSSNSNKQKNEKSKNNKPKQAHGHSQNQTEQQYSQRIKSELNFYISNLDCKNQQNQLLVLQIIEQWVKNRTKTQIEQVSELILLSLSTSVVNGNEHVQKINQIMESILKTIDKTKTYELLQKALIWISQPRQKKLIVECGFFLLYSILQNKAISIDNNTIKSQYLLKNSSNSFLNTISNILTQQVATLQDYIISLKTSNKKSKVQNKDWNNILDAIDTEDSNPYLSQNRILQFCLKVIQILVQNQEYQTKFKQAHIIKNIWILLKIPQDKICQVSIRLLVKISSLGVHLQSQFEAHSNVQNEEQEQEDNQDNNQKQKTKGFKLKFNFRSTIYSLINNHINQDSIISLIQKLNQQITIGEHVYTSTFNLIIGLLGKIVMKFKVMQSKTDKIYSLFNTILQDTNKNYLLFKNQQRTNKIIDAVGKVSRSEFVSVQCKALNQQSINFIKQIVGVSQFYKALTKIQSQRRQKKSQQKAQLARLAVVDQKAYQDAKKKKVKTQSI